MLVGGLCRTFAQLTGGRIDQLQKAIVVQSRSLDEIAVLAEDKEKFLSAIPAIQPVQNKDLKHMASGYGYRTDPFTKARKFHWGMDFTAPRGTPVYASGDGVVKRADSNSSGYGKHIRIDHGYGYVSLYAHLYKYNVKPNQKVKRGDIIGYVGSTGRSEAPHLHYEIFKDGERINPINFYYGNLTAEEYANLLEKASLEKSVLFLEPCYYSQMGTKQQEATSGKRKFQVTGVEVRQNHTAHRTEIMS